ncbi:hypothetical protein HPP92_015995 [Vanilla planifolia]|uniref:Uncharacterized protein n=1 Tax=Vanilla planifolia TaxID=51239 RepID=A0A835QKP6_VANPL|nr:hypothetical protein HPP92_016611 [Vanilla planifolia]KAG0471449.1 hypothetical protein HPP92_015995 [Vanilla planifolia]
MILSSSPLHNIREDKTSLIVLKTQPREQGPTPPFGFKSCLGESIRAEDIVRIYQVLDCSPTNWECELGLDRSLRRHHLLRLLLFLVLLLLLSVKRTYKHQFSDQQRSKVGLSIEVVVHATRVAFGLEKRAAIWPSATGKVFRLYSERVLVKGGGGRDCEGGEGTAEGVVNGEPDTDVLGWQRGLVVMLFRLGTAVGHRRMQGLVQGRETSQVAAVAGR